MKNNNLYLPKLSSSWLPNTIVSLNCCENLIWLFWVIKTILANEIIAGIVILVSTTLAIRIVGIVILIYAVLDIIARMIFIKKVQDYLDK